MKNLFINALTDFGIKLLFGTKENKDLLIDFLNAFLPCDKKIVNLIYLNNERPGKTVEHRKAVYDLFCLSSTGEYFIIELQKASQHFIKSRSFYYSAVALQEQAIPGDWNFELKETYTICILDFCFDEAHPELVIHNVKLIEQETGEIFDDNITYIYLEMPKFKKSEQELINRKEKWLFVLKNLSSFTEIPLTLRKDPIFQKVFQIALLGNLTKKEMNAYELALKDKRDYKNTIDYAVDKGVERKMIEIAIKMIQKGAAFEFVQEISDLPLDILQKLFATHHT